MMSPTQERDRRVLYRPESIFLMPEKMKIILPLNYFSQGWLFS